jgi:hypothetical protein
VLDLLDARLVDWDARDDAYGELASGDRRSVAKVSAWLEGQPERDGHNYVESIYTLAVQGNPLAAGGDDNRRPGR